MKTNYTKKFKFYDLRMIWLKDNIYRKAVFTKNYNDFLYLIEELHAMFYLENMEEERIFDELNYYFK